MDKEKMKQETRKSSELGLYRIIPSYIDILSDESNGGDKRVQTVRGKENRPFIGVVVINDRQKYCIPLTSIAGKPKLKGRGGIKGGAVDYSPIYINGIVKAGVQFGRMIPVTDNVLRKITITPHKHDTPEQKAAKRLRKEELAWIQENKYVIINKARTLYDLYTSNRPFRRRDDCLNFPQLEKICREYELVHVSQHYKQDKDSNHNDCGGNELTRSSSGHSQGSSNPKDSSKSKNISYGNRCGYSGKLQNKNVKK